MRGTVDGALAIVLKQGAHSEIAVCLNSGSPRHRIPARTIFTLSLSAVKQ